MNALFIELPAFERHRGEYLDDARFLAMQNLLLAQPVAGDVVAGTGGLRKLRLGDLRRGKGKRGGLRIIYFWWPAGREFWLFAIYDKDEMVDLGPRQRVLLRRLLDDELATRRPH